MRVRLIILFFAFGEEKNLIKELAKLNWAPFVLGLVIVGYFAYHEALIWNKIVGVVVCLIGLVF